MDNVKKDSTELTSKMTSLSDDSLSAASGGMDSSPHFGTDYYCACEYPYCNWSSGPRHTSEASIEAANKHKAETKHAYFRYWQQPR